MFLNPRLNLGCSMWCQYADKCIGTIGKEEIKENLTLAMKEYFEGDRRRTDNALKVLGFAKKILEKENGNPKVVIAAAILHDIGVFEMERKHEKTQGSDQEKDRLPMVRGILERSGCEKEVIEEVCQIIENHHSSDKVDTLNSKIVYDADRLVNLRDGYDTKNKEKLKKLISRIFLTDTGKKIAEEIYLGCRLCGPFRCKD